MLKSNKYLITYLLSNLVCLLMLFININKDLLNTYLYILAVIPFILLFLLLLIKDNSFKTFTIMLIFISIGLLWFNRNIFSNYFEFDLYSITSFVYFLIFTIFAFVSPKAKQNYLFGVRIYYTLEYKEVWDKTHKVFGLLYTFCILPSFLTIFYTNGINKFIIVNALVILTTVVILIYANIIGKKYEKIYLEKEKAELNEQIRRENGY